VRKLLSLENRHLLVLEARLLQQLLVPQLQSRLVQRLTLEDLQDYQQQQVRRPRRLILAMLCLQLTIASNHNNTVYWFLFSI